LQILPDNSTRFYSTDEDKSSQVKKQLGILDLEYLQNYQIASSYLSGPHGWCSWTGVICCDGYGIGKWPTVEEVLVEWKLIANTWPFLNLKCQLLSNENNDSSSKPLIQYIVKNGEVSLSLPKDLLFLPLLRHTMEILHYLEEKEDVSSVN
jgi:hypothetical protein